MFFRLFSAAIAVLVAACSTLVYQEPATGARARVRFVTNSNSISVLRTYGDKNCSMDEVEWLRLRNGTLVNSLPKRLGMPLWNYHDNAAKEVYVEANKPIHGMFQGGETTSGRVYLCGAPFRYSFEEHADYEVKFWWSPQECRVTLARIIDTPSGPKFKELAAFSNQINEENRGCLEAFNKRRLY